MPMQKTNPKTGFAGESTIKLIPSRHTSYTVMVRIKTIHDRCQGLFDEQQQEVDGDLVCHDQDEQVSLDLARISIDDLEEEVDQIIVMGGYHGLEHEDDVSYVYINQDLQRVLAGGEGFVEVVWDF